MQKRYAIIIDNIVNNVVIWDDEQGPFPEVEGAIAVVNGWACVGDWYEISEGRFYTMLPNDKDANAEG